MFTQAVVTQYGNAVAAAVNAAVGLAADDIVREMKATVPKKSGKLASTIDKEPLGNFGWKITAGGRETTNAKGYDYALAVEFGNHHAASNPFFYASYRRKKAKAKRAIVNSVREALRKKP